MPSVAVRKLAFDETLALRLLAGSRGGGARLRSAQASDLAHPGRYVLPGEVVLTNGLWTDEVGAAEWVDEVRLAGGVGIGFGISARHPTVPEELCAACDRRRLPLFEVPENVSFASVSQRVHEWTATDASALLRHQLQRTRQLAQSLAGGGGRAELLRVLEQETGLQGAFVGPGGRMMAHRGTRITADIAASASHAALRGSLPSPVGDAATAFGLPGQRRHSTLVVGAPMAAISDDARLIIEQIAAFIAFEDARADGFADGRQALAGELVRLLREGELGDAAFEARLEALGLDPRGGVQVVCAPADGDLLRYAADACGLRYAVAQSDEDYIVLAQAGGDSLVGQLRAALAEAGADPVLGTSPVATGVSGVRRALAQARAALRLADRRPPGERVVDAGEVGSATLLLELLEPSAIAAYRSAVLGPLEAWDREHGGQLLPTLRTFLEVGGRWREAAALLHVHHNTLRYRLQRVEELTGRRLAVTAERVDLFLALAAADGDPGREDC